MASKTIVATAGTPPPAAGVWFAYMSLAMYDAVNAITGQYQPVYYRTPGLFRRLYGRSSGRRRASRTRQLFSCAAVRLGRFFRNVDRGINGSPQAISDGKAIGEAATQAGISARARDGLLASISYTPGSGPEILDPDAPEFPGSGHALAWTDAPIYDASPRRLSSRPSTCADKRDLEKRLQSPPPLGRRNQHRTIRRGSRDRYLLDGESRSAIHPRLQQPD